MADSSVVARGLDQIGAMLGDVTEDRLTDPTPCADWTVGDLVDHVVEAPARMATMLQGGEVDWTADTPHHDDPAAAFSTHADDLVGAVSAAGEDVPQGMVLAELAVHAWDLSTALGRDSADLEPEVAEAGHAFMAQNLTEEQRGQAFAPERPAPEGADAYQRLAAFAGREV